MELQKPRIALYAKRSFGEKLNATFEFVKENWKPLLKYATYLILPICLLQALALDGFMNSSLLGYKDLVSLSEGEMANAAPALVWNTSMLLSYISLIILSALLSWLQLSLVFALIQLYYERENRLAGITFSEIKPVFIQNLGRTLLIGLLGVAFMVFAVLILAVFGALLPYSLFLLVPLFLIALVPLALLFPVGLFEKKISVLSVFQKAFKLGFVTWFGVFFLNLVILIIVGMIQGVASLPYYVSLIIKMMLTMSDGGVATTSVVMSLAQFLFAALALYVSYVGFILALVGLSFQYGHATEIVDNVTIENDIENFDKL